jgi:PQQ-like domain
MKRTIGYLLVVICILNPVLAEDWPEWRGKGRAGIWTESGILDKFPEKGLTPVWRTPLHGGFAGPAVAAGRVFVTDFKRSSGKKGMERALCLDEKSGKILWTREWDADYQGISYDTGPRATPTVDGDRVYIVGGSGTLLCLNARSQLQSLEFVRAIRPLRIGQPGQQRQDRILALLISRQTERSRIVNIAVGVADQLADDGNPPIGIAADLHGLMFGR